MSRKGKISYKAVEPLSQILTHYSCPESCAGFCCHNNIIEFLPQDLKRIKRAYPESVEIFKNCSTSYEAVIQRRKFTVFRITVDPCPFLKNNRCSIHAMNPIICAEYPFTFGKGQSIDHVGIDPCPMGVEISADYLLHQIDLVNHCMVPQCLKDEKIEELKKPFFTILKESQHFRDKHFTSMVFIPRESMAGFLEFLETYSREEILDQRKLYGLSLP